MVTAFIFCFIGGLLTLRFKHMYNSVPEDRSQDIAPAFTGLSFAVVGSLSLYCWGIGIFLAVKTLAA